MHNHHKSLNRTNHNDRLITKLNVLIIINAFKYSTQRHNILNELGILMNDINIKFI
jgi:hypothetical protein